MADRTAQRTAYGEAARISLLEHDADEFESALATIKTLLVGILVSTTTAAILLALNLIVQTAKPV